MRSCPTDYEIIVFSSCLKIVVDAEDKAALAEVTEILTELAQLKWQNKTKIIPPKAATRNTRGPVFFKFVRVEYDKEKRRLELSKGEFAWRAVKAYERGGEKDKAEYNGMELEDLSGKIIDQRNNKSMNSLFLMTMGLPRLNNVKRQYR